MLADSSFSFDIKASTPPEVATFYPGDASSEAPLNTVISVTFNESVQNVDAASFTVNSTLLAGVVPGVISTVNNITWSFTPSAALLLDDTISVALTTAITDQEGSNLAAGNNWTFNTKASTPPVIVTHYPDVDALEVPKDSDISITFNETILGLNAGSFTVNGSSSGSISGAFSTSNNIAWTFNPTADFVLGETVTITVADTITDSESTNLAADYSWSFTAKTSTPPYTVTTIPEDSTIETPLNMDISVSFNEVVQNVTTSTFQVSSAASGALTGVITTTNDMTWTFNPTIDLLLDDTITVTLADTIIDNDNTAMLTPFVFTFDTKTSTPPDVFTILPANLASEVPLASDISVTFDEKVQNVTTSNFEITGSVSGAISGVISTSNDITWTFNPDSLLALGETITVSITNTITDLESTAMSAPYGWTFDTKASTPPVVTTNYPADGVSEIPLSADVTVTFNEIMQNIDTSSFTVSGSVSGVHTGVVSTSN